MAAAIFSGVSGGARSKTAEAFSRSSRIRRRSAGMPRRHSRTSVSEAAAMSGGTSSSSVSSSSRWLVSSKAETRFDVDTVSAAVAFVSSGESGLDAAELRAIAAVLAASFEGDVGASVEGGMLAALVSADAFVLESLFE